MIQIFNTTSEYNTFSYNNTDIKSGNLYYVKEDGNVHFLTNNIDGVTRIYDKGNIPSGTKTITENGENIDVFSYSYVTVNTPQPSGTLTITENGENIDVFSYSYVTVNTPQPVSGSLLKTKVNVPSTSSATWVLGSLSYISEMYVDGVKIEEPALKYTFDTTGEHSVDYMISPTEAIADSQFSNRWNVTNIELPNGISYIGSAAFEWLDSVTSLKIPATVRTIGAGAFWGMSNLTTINIPEGVTILSDNLFNNCQKLTNVVLPSTVTEIGSSSFNVCKGITTIDIPNSVTTIKYNAFGQCSNLTTVTIGNGITSIGEQAFMNCSKLSSVTITATTPPTGLNYSTFSGNASGRKIYVPAESVDAYKAASGWSGYASDIEAIS